MRRPPLGLLFAGSALLLGTAVTSAVGTPHRRGPAEQVEVVGATVVCPDLRQLAGSIQTRVSVGAAPLPKGRDAAPGAMLLRQVGGEQASVPVPVQDPGQVAVGLAGTVNEDAIVVSASGSLAAGLEVEQVTRGNGGPYRGLAGLRCQPPSPEAWFLGGSTQIRDNSVLVLANVEDAPATLDVTVFSSKGPSDPRAGQGITIAPRSRAIIPLDTLAPDASHLAVHVLARRGRVAAALRSVVVVDRTPLGVDWVPQSQPPATRVIVPGFPQGPGQRRLLIANPGTDDTTVQVQVTTADGQFVPTGMDEVTVPAQHSIFVSLDTICTTSAVAATVTSSGGPVLAGGLVDDMQDPPVHEISYTGSALPLSGSSLLTDLVIDHPTESTLILTAPDTASSVIITPIQVLGAGTVPPAPRSVQVPAGRTVIFRLSTFFRPGISTRLAVEVRPGEGGGPVYAARYLRERGAHGPLTTLLLLQGPAAQVPRQRVVADPQAGYPGH